MSAINVLRPVVLLAAIVGCALALPKISSKREPELLQRQKRATPPHQVFSANKPDKWKGCPKGRYFTNATESGEFGCVKCPRHTFAHKYNIWKNCVPCPHGEGTPGEAALKCFTHCTPGWGWDKNRGKIFADGSREGKCYPCPRGTYNAGSNVDECQRCAKFHTTPSTESTNSEACGLACPKGFESYPTPDGDLTCRACPFGTYQKYAGVIGDNKPCEPCPASKNWTLSTGSVKGGNCFKPWNGFKMEFAAMMHALDFAQHVVRDDVDKSKKLLFALCHSVANLDELKEHYTKLKKKEITIANQLENPVPALRINKDETLTYDDVFEDGVPSCDEAYDWYASGSGSYGSGSSWSGSGSSSYGTGWGWSGSGSSSYGTGWGWSGSTSCSCATGWSGYNTGWSSSGYNTGWSTGSGGSSSGYNTGWSSGGGWSSSGYNTRWSSGGGWSSSGYNTGWSSGGGWSSSSGWSSSGYNTGWSSGGGWSSSSGWSSSGYNTGWSSGGGWSSSGYTTGWSSGGGWSSSGYNTGWSSGGGWSSSGYNTGWSSGGGWSSSGYNTGWSSGGGWSSSSGWTGSGSWSGSGSWTGYTTASGSHTTSSWNLM